ncbi:hypothetical protein PAL_GLEAN10015881 [Pteropus alecto]|uniref:Uncharacterized protein n=1 Tax=Pteropus alecto TaxID=9402 RepID=L5L0Q5_PTEAL|nr:hypothetical protein PAL_GLEAN10015881 [Pteropus alecto]
MSQMVQGVQVLYQEANRHPVSASLHGSVPLTPQNLIFTQSLSVLTFSPVPNITFGLVLLHHSLYRQARAIGGGVEKRKLEWGHVAVESLEGPPAGNALQTMGCMDVGLKEERDGDTDKIAFIPTTSSVTPRLRHWCHPCKLHVVPEVGFAFSLLKAAALPFSFDHDAVSMALAVTLDNSSLIHRTDLVLGFR